LVSKIRVLLGMLVLLALAIGTIALLAAMKAAAVWFTIVPLGILFFGAFVAQSLGWFDKKAGT
jgi:ABC-type nitrate/sulfonate/bicarbonate transport system substrate-binding protein